MNSTPRPLVHLELHTDDRAAAGAFYAALLHWLPEMIETRCGSYLAFEPGSGLGRGIVECGTRRPLWLPTSRWIGLTNRPTARGSSAHRCCSSHAKDMLDNGDQNAFARLVEPYRHELQVHCYRMLGSYADAEDAMQEVLLRAWRGLPRFEGRSSLRSWLYRIATNTSLRTLERRPKRVLPIDYQPAGDPHDGLADPVTDPIWLEPYPDVELGLEGPAGPEARYEQREAIELAFIAAIQNLPARQRAVLILRDVLSFSARETAAVLEATPVSIDSALQRAHRAVDDRLPSQSQQQTLRLLGDDELSALVERWVAAWERNDVDSLVSMLAEDARIVMPPHPSWYSGRDQVALFLRTYPLRADRRWKLVPTSANGQVAVGSYMWDEQAGAFTPHGISVLTLRGNQIEEIMAFHDPELLEPFALPVPLPV